MDRLATFVDAWKRCAADVEELLRSLGEHDWDRDTDCPEWTVRDIAAHLAALESELAGDPGPRLDQHAAATGSVASAYTQAGIDERRDRTPSELIEEFVEAVHRRAVELDTDPPSDPEAIPPRSVGGMGWDWQTLLRNRVVDLWVHEQDIRRAVGRPGGLDSPAAQVTRTTFVSALPYVIGKRAGSPPASTVAVDLDGEELAFVVDDGGRCRPTDDRLESATARLTMSSETFSILAAGRRDPLTVDVRIAGDRELAERILQGMAVTA
jgi:uncharacterized protein (TIGR03083 family)